MPLELEGKDRGRGVSRLERVEEQVLSGYECKAGRVYAMAMGHPPMLLHCLSCACGVLDDAHPPASVCELRLSWCPSEVQCVPPVLTTSPFTI